MEDNFALGLGLDILVQLTSTSFKDWTVDGMTAILAALIAVGGTIIGATVTFAFQRAMARQAASMAFLERLRQDRFETCAAFAAAALRYRQAELDRWHRHDEDPVGAPYHVARTDSYRLRSALREALQRVRLISDDLELHRLAALTLDKTRTIHKASDPEERISRATESRSSIDVFIAHAATYVQTPPTTILGAS